ncbi:glutamate 5-kinase [Candidatus Gastranaerophilus sp. (ex Termes propinquus)]|nr:glutamate 5-kinase [Candidatus Gastranaerophilus sp. (ex Termes propinquus)]
MVVTSGAVGLGAKKLNLQNSKGSLFDKQAFASVGQSLLMRIWEECFAKFDVNIGQILLTEDDFSNRKKYLALRNTLNTLLEYKVVPVINQNDVVSTSELESSNTCKACFSDNDKLSALVASKLDADLLVLVSDINGLYDKNPKDDKSAKLIPVVEKITPKIEKSASGATLGGRGGMITKLQAAKIANRTGACAMIINGTIEHIIQKIFNGAPNIPSTVFKALPQEVISGKKRWIAYATNIMGKLIVNDGARDAIVLNQKSLLAVGIVAIEGEFSRNDVVAVYDEKNGEIAHGIVNYDSGECRKILGEHSDKIEEILGDKVSNDVISKDNLVII